MEGWKDGRRGNRRVNRRAHCRGISREFTRILEQIASGTNRANKTAAFAGGVRVDCVLPSATGFLDISQSGVYWARTTDLTFYLNDASDHHSVWVDLRLDSTNTAAASLTYDQWWRSYGYFAIGAPTSGRTLDADADGLSNFAEYVFGTNPNSANAAVTELEDGPPGKEFTYRRNRSATVTWRIEYATDLSAAQRWTPAVLNTDYIVVSSAADPADPSVEITRVRLLNSSGSPRIFARIFATE